MINENPLTKHIFLSLIENQYYKDNHQLISEIGNLNAYNSPIIINKDGEIVNNIDKDPPSSDNESSKDISSESEIEEISKNEKIPKNEENQKKLIFENPFFTTEETIYDDLNYGDFVLACQNPLYHYQIPERIRSIVHFKTVNQKLGKKINLSKKVKYWLKQLKKQEGVNLENIKVDSLFSKYNSKGNQVMDQTDIDKDVIKHVDVKQVKDNLDRCSPKKAWISLEEAGKIYDICIGSNRGTFLGDGEGDESYFGLKELHQKFMNGLEVAFKNAVLFHSKEYYQEEYSFENQKYEYGNVRLDQLPFTYHATPLLKNFFEKNKNEIKNFIPISLKDIIDVKQMEENESKNSTIHLLKITIDDEDQLEKENIFIEDEEDHGIKEEEKEQEEENNQELDIRLIDPKSDLFQKKGEYKLRVCIFKDLMRRAMLLKFMKIGLFTREFYSTDMKLIFVVIKAQENMVAKRAEVLGMLKELEIGYTDLISLEPIDKLMRPFRFKESLLNKIVKDISDENSLTEDLKEGNEANPLLTKKKNNFEKIKGFDESSVIDFIEKLKSMDDKEFTTQWKNQVKEQIETFDEISAILDQREIVKEYSVSLEEQMKRKFNNDDFPSRDEISHFLTFFNLITNYSRKIKEDYFDEDGKIINSNLVDIGKLYSGSFLNSLRETRTAYTKIQGESKDCFKNFLKKVYIILGLGTAIDEENGAYIGTSMNRKVLPTIWDQFGVKPFGPFIPFTAVEKQITQFKHEEINELGHQKIFNSRDRIKVVYSLILETCHIFKLHSYGIVQEFMPLHDPYVLKGLKKKDLFDDIPPFDTDKNFLEKKNLNLNLKSKSNITNPNLADDPVGQTVLNLVRGSRSKLNYQGKGSKKEMNPLKKILAFKWKSPLTIHHLSIHRYFGAAVSLYFSFLQFFVRKVQFIGFFGAIIFFTDTLMIKGGINGGLIGLGGYHATRITFSMIIVIWTSSFLQYWKRRETMFAARFNGDDLKLRNRNSSSGSRYNEGGMTIDERRRLAYQGHYSRDLTNSNYNNIFYRKGSRFCFKTISFIVSFLLLSISIGLTCTILYIKYQLYSRWKENLGFIQKNLLTFLPPVINFACAKTLIKIHQKLAIKFTYKENYKTVAQFEKVLIHKVYIFNFLNLFNSILIIMFVKPLFEDFFGECMPLNDAIEATKAGKYRLLSDVVNGFFGVLKGVPMFKGRMKKKKRSKIVPSRAKTKYSKIDHLIEEEYYLFPYQTTPEIDAVFSEYMEVMLIFGFLCCFGNIFPLGFLLVFLTIATEIFTDKYKIVNIVRRPIPKKVSRLGPWREIMSILAYLSIVVNSAFVSFGSKSADYFAAKVLNFNPYLTRTSGLGSSFNSEKSTLKDGELITDEFEIEERVALIRITFFLFYILILTLIKKIINKLIDDIPKNLKNLLRRHRHIEKQIKINRTSNGESDDEEIEEEPYNSGFHFRLDEEDKNAEFEFEEDKKEIEESVQDKNIFENEPEMENIENELKKDD